MKNMVELSGGAFRMGCDCFYPEERPVQARNAALVRLPLASGG
jgi:hypothetical protein